MNKLQPKDIVAISCLVSITVLKLNGFNGYLDGLIALIVGYYFAHRKTGDDSGV